METCRILDSRVTQKSSKAPLWKKVAESGEAVGEVTGGPLPATETEWRRWKS